jgi:hypothetical protein
MAIRFKQREIDVPKILKKLRNRARRARESAMLRATPGRASPNGPSAEGFFQRYGFQMEMTREKSPLLGNPPTLLRT